MSEWVSGCVDKGELVGVRGIEGMDEGDDGDEGDELVGLRDGENKKIPHFFLFSISFLFHLFLFSSPQKKEKLIFSFQKIKGEILIIRHMNLQKRE